MFASVHISCFLSLVSYQMFPKTFDPQFPFGIQAAACARVGNALGAGDTARAILSSKVSLTLAGL